MESGEIEAEYKDIYPPGNQFYEIYSQERAALEEERINEQNLKRK